MERRAEATGGRTRRAGRDPASPSGSAPAVADSRAASRRGGARASLGRFGAGRAAPSAGAGARGPRRATTRDAQLSSVSSARTKGDDDAGRVPRAAEDDDTFAIRSRSDLPIVDVVEGWSASQPTRRARVCPRGPAHPRDEKAPPVMTFSHVESQSPRFSTWSIITGWTTRRRSTLLVEHSLPGRQRLVPGRWTTSPRARLRLASQHAPSRTPPPPPLVLSDTLLVLSDTLLVLSASVTLTTLTRRRQATR